MLRNPSRMTSSVRVFADSGWQDCAPLRWVAQLLVGGLPGVLVCLVIMWMASAPQQQGSGAHIASIVPLLSASGLADSPAFHRLKFEVAAAAGRAPQFRLPDAAGLPLREDLTTAVTVIPPSAVDFNGPRTAWKHLGPAIRSRIDASLVLRHDWERIVLHGSGVNHGNARLLNRYHANVRGMAQGLAYHFVISNGAGAADGLVEAGDRWARAMPAGDIADTDLHETSISICLVGDFNEQAPSTAQLEALDELKDYLSIKLGKLELTTHRADDGSPSSCLGIKFPAGDMLLKK